MAPETEPPLTLLTVNGHPDDESVLVGGVMARYAAEGKRVVCVVATRGEVGEIARPELDSPVNRARLGELREQELRAALSHLGAVEAVFLDYRDSGMAGTQQNADPRSFWAADIGEATGRLVRVIRSVRADVIVAPNRFGGDGHPDHVRASDVATLAFARAGDPDAYPEQLDAGRLEPWSPSKLYETVLQLDRRAKLRQALRTSGPLMTLALALRVGVRWRPRRELGRMRIAAAQSPITTRVNVGPWLEAKRAAMAEHRTQIRSDAALFVLTPQERSRIEPTEAFALRASRVRVDIPEQDLFAGVATGRDRQLAPETA